MRPSNLSHSDDLAEKNLSAIKAKHLRVLIIDDEPLWRRSMSFRLSRLYDAQVKAVASGEEAIRAIERGESFDVIFLDLYMPDMSGTETYDKLRSIDAKCSVIMMSAYLDGEEWARAKDLNVELLSKPISDEELEETLLKVRIG
jgi:two-component system, chemotaxis family, chemotaxis protein CheY